MINQKFLANNITKSYGGNLILKGVDVSFSRNEIVGILGPNGAGKTTLFSILTGIIQPNSGQIILNDINITKYSLHERSRMGIIYLPQDSSIFRGLSVEDNIKAVLEIKHKNKELIDDKLNYLLEAFSIDRLRKSRSTALSGGERRKVEIARAIAADPLFLMLDEPFSGIDPISIIEIMDIIKKLKDLGIGVIITDHNVRETLSILDRGYIIANGTVLFHGTANEILGNEESRNLYLGNNFKI